MQQMRIYGRPFKDRKNHLLILFTGGRNSEMKYIVLTRNVILLTNPIQIGQKVPCGIGEIVFVPEIN